RIFRPWRRTRCEGLPRAAPHRGTHGHRGGSVLIEATIVYQQGGRTWQEADVDHRDGSGQGSHPTAKHHIAALSTTAAGQRACRAHSLGEHVCPASLLLRDWIPYPTRVS